MKDPYVDFMFDRIPEEGPARLQGVEDQDGNPFDGGVWYVRSDGQAILRVRSLISKEVHTYTDEEFETVFVPYVRRAVFAEEQVGRLKALLCGVGIVAICAIVVLALNGPGVCH